MTKFDNPKFPDQLGTLLRLTERYCVVYQSLASPVGATATIVTRPSPPG